jgi:hypothetical protein
MFRLLQQQRFPWAPGSFVLTIALLALIGLLLPAPENRGHLSGGTLTIELGILALVAAVIIILLAFLRQPQASPFARAPSTSISRARTVRAVARAAVPLGVGAALVCQGIGRSLIQNDSSAAPAATDAAAIVPNSTGVALLLIAQFCFFGGFAIGAFFRPFSLARVTRPTLRGLLWVLVVIEWVAMFAASALANGIGQQGHQIILYALPALLFVDTTSLALLIGSLLLFRHTLARAEHEAGGPIMRSDWPRIFWDAGSAKIALYGLALIVLGLGALPSHSASDPLWLSELCACLVFAIIAAIAPSPAPAALPSAANESASIAGNR